MSSKLRNWFIELSRVAQLSVLGSIALGGIFITSAMSQPQSTPIIETQSNQPETIQVQQEVKKESIVTTKTETETEPILFNKKTIEDNTMADGSSVITTIGINGEKTITSVITYTDGVETSRKESEKITKTPVDQVTSIGTYVAPKPVSNCDSNYSPCVPKVSYDLDCRDIGFTVTVIGYDVHRFDGDDDGYGCESY